MADCWKLAHYHNLFKGGSPHNHNSGKDDCSICNLQGYCPGSCLILARMPVASAASISPLIIVTQDPAASSLLTTSVGSTSIKRLSSGSAGYMDLNGVVHVPLLLESCPMGTKKP